MVGREKGLWAEVSRKAPHVRLTHCAIHRESLAAKGLPSELQNVLNTTVKIINFIKSRSKNDRIFREICKDFDSDFMTLVMYTEVRWLSRGNAISRAYKLKEEIFEFGKTYDFTNKDLRNGKLKIFQDFEKEEFQKKLAYLTDIFEKLNIVNKTLQGSISKIQLDKNNNLINSFSIFVTFLGGQKSTVFETEGKIQETKQMVKFLLRHSRNKNFSVFPTFSEISTNCTEATANLIIEHLECLDDKFERYFPSNNVENRWILNPFIFNLDNIPPNIPINSKEELVRLSANSYHESRFDKDALCRSWCNLKPYFPELSNMAFKTLTEFSNTYLCEKSFSHMLFLKNDYRSQINVEMDLRVHLSPRKPKFIV
jgi:hypothetical protein